MEKPPRYVICRCQHCDGHIEFDANEFTEDNSIVPCPHCGLETKLFIPASQTEKVSTELRPSVASPNAIRREGFFCGGGEPIPRQVSAEQPATEGRSERHPLGNAPELTEDQIKSVGERQNDGMAVKLYHEGDQDMAMSLDDARRYIADPRFKLINPETGLRFTPATLEAFIKAKRPQNKNEAAPPTDQQTPRLPKSKTVILTQAQCETPLAKELVGLLVDIEKEGFGTDAGVRRLNEWLEAKADSEIPAVSFLLDITRNVLSCGNITPENAAKMQNAIVRVLPRHIQIAEINSEEFSERLPARKSMLKRIRELGGNPPPGITRAEAYALKAKLQSQPSEKQLDYIRALGGNPPPDITRWDASSLIEQLLSSTKATQKQLDYIRSLGGNPSPGLSRADVDEIIPQLQQKFQESLAKQQSPSSRQIMVLRFWNRMDLEQSSKWEVEQLLTQFYDEDPRRRAAWETFKLENGDDGSQRDPSWVMLGAGERYLNKTD